MARNALPSAIQLETAPIVRNLLLVGCPSQKATVLVLPKSPHYRSCNAPSNHRPGLVKEVTAPELASQLPEGTYLGVRAVTAMAQPRSIRSRSRTIPHLGQLWLGIPELPNLRYSGKSEVQQ
jgi:hypothetical protein